ncbi:hypothetical protein K438DRAFT_1762417 [Mycena galopus ATCC 62051]|nr:hypothetical protein K438DRAFT_1762417 [Mycena galopus ATCC 62051]
MDVNRAIDATNIAEQEGDPGQSPNFEDSSQDGLLWLTSNIKEWLLFLDNVDDPSINLNDLVPMLNTPDSSPNTPDSTSKPIKTQIPYEPPPNSIKTRIPDQDHFGRLIS